VKFLDLLSYVLPEVAGCTDLLVERALRDTLADLCLRAKVWSEKTYPQNTVPGVADYDVDLPCCAELVEIKWLAFDNRRLFGVPDETPALGQAPGTPRAYAQLTPDTVTLVPAPDTAAPLTMTLTLRPTLDGVDFPDWLITRYQDALLAGAKARLLMMTGRAWFAPQQALAYQAMYAAEVARAMYDTAHGAVRGPLRTISQH
jgi:hypothetical protein